jgi:hypothetical protein
VSLSSCLAVGCGLWAGAACGRPPEARGRRAPAGAGAAARSGGEEDARRQPQPLQQRHPARTQMPKLVGAVDQGTSSTRFILFDESGAQVAKHQVCGILRCVVRRQDGHSHRDAATTGSQPPAARTSVLTTTPRPMSVPHLCRWNLHRSTRRRVGASTTQKKYCKLCRWEARPPQSIESIGTSQSACSCRSVLSAVAGSSHCTVAARLGVRAHVDLHQRDDEAGRGWKVLRR